MRKETVSLKSDSVSPGRDAILEAVIHIVAQNGLRGLTFRSVGEAAQVSPTLAAHHFGTRDRMIAEALRWSLDHAIDATHLTTFGQNEADYVEAVTGTLLTNPDLHAFQFEMIMEASRRTELQSEIRTMYRTYLKELEAATQSVNELSPDLLRAYFASIDGLLLQFLGGAINLEQFRASLMQMTVLVRHIEPKT